MKLEICNVKYEDDIDINMLPVVRDIIKKKLIDYKIKVDIKLLNDKIVFVEQKDEKALKLFMSSVSNKIPLKITDARYKPDKPYLKTHRLTADQYKGLQNVFNGTFDNLKLKGDIKYYEDDKDENSFIALRFGNTNGVWPKLPINSPIAM